MNRSDRTVSLHDFDLFNPTDEHRMLRETVAEFVATEVEPQAAEYNRDERFNLKLFRKAGELGLLGVTVPEAYGGSGMDATAAVIVHEEISASDPGFGLAYLAHAMLCANNLAVNGGEDIKRRALPKLCTGEWVGAMAMTEPAVGTDVLSMGTRAERKGNDYYLTGRKMWITNGTVDEAKTPCDCVLVYARTGESNGRARISTFLVEKGMPGFSVGQKIHDKLGMRASPTAELVFESCKVPATSRVGEEGESMKHMMRNLEIERLTLAAQSLGIARRCIEIMNRYATERTAFGKPIREFGQIQAHIAGSYAEFRACRSYVYDVARKLDLQSEGNRLDSDGAKLVASGMAKRVADRAIQTLGGYGYVGEYIVERLWRDAKLLEIGGGTVEAHQKNMVREMEKLL